tara:strand:- start:4000 stop:4980 length:981 start_codon:yes stop_codon:yes gene_type:complete
VKKGKYRKNPKTNDLFARGDKRDDGYTFIEYKNVILKNGFFKEGWRSPRPEGTERLNEKGERFKNGDVREDGKIFWGYDRSKVLKNGFYSENWRATQGEGFKRINPKTNVPFKSGDIDERGMVFCHYHLKLTRKDGSFKENWITQEAFNKRRETAKQFKAKKLSEGLQKPGKKRLNPQTNQFLKLGDRREDGAYFIQYRMQIVLNNGYCSEEWASDYDTYHKLRFKHSLATYRRSNKKLGRDDFDLDIDFLKKIYPKDGKCPILKSKLEWSSKGNEYSPSLDRIDSNKGYTRDNVMWMSRKANTMKSSASVKELKDFAKWIRKNID